MIRKDWIKDYAFKDWVTSTEAYKNKAHFLYCRCDGGKCKIISTSTESIKIDGKNVDHVEEFVFLSSVVPDTSADVMRELP